MIVKENFPTPICNVSVASLSLKLRSYFIVCHVHMMSLRPHDVAQWATSLLIHYVQYIFDDYNVL